MGNKIVKRNESLSEFDSNQSVFLSLEERIKRGKSMRKSTPRESHAEWNPKLKRKDPIKILEHSNKGRMNDLIPIRYGRMIRTPFTFLRGAASLMAYDLASTPSTGEYVQACGDCHLMNFGLFATPERNLIFDINDFDETLPAPWEWDVKRLAVSFIVAARDVEHSHSEGKRAAMACVRAYREKMAAYAKMSPLEVWYDKLDAKTLIKNAPDEDSRKNRIQIARKARERIGEYLLPKIATKVDGRHRLVDQHPVLFHVEDTAQSENTLHAIEEYRMTLSDERRKLWDRYRIEDIAIKVVGIGSVGTRCFVGLFFSAENHPLLMQFKEARPSVLEPYAQKTVYRNNGQRIVNGQRLMQASSDIFLGWTRSRLGFEYYARQLRDMKFSMPLNGITPQRLHNYAEVCGWTLARAHARSGDAALLSGYMGKSVAFDKAIGDFSVAYADQNNADYQKLVNAIAIGKIKALIEEDL
ncbi:MAG TPA: DUF2252 domain-containing protein [Alcaligenaceae bacterium]|nr:DUF2252 domain-containing protein [Alcaligenaceae bacterium]